jgi:hypothetical protein
MELQGFVNHINEQWRNYDGVDDSNNKISNDYILKILIYLYLLSDCFQSELKRGRHAHLLRKCSYAVKFLRGYLAFFAFRSNY